MSTLKQCLKAAKKAIEENDYETVLEYCEDVFEQDPQNYLGYVFKGKAFQLKGDIPSAIKAFEEATRIDPDNLVGWKGYYQSVKLTQDYPKYFEVLGNLLQVQLEQNVPIGDTMKDVWNWLTQLNYKSNPELYETLLRSILPGTHLGEMVGNLFGKLEDTVRNLVDLEKKKVDKLIADKVAKERVKFGRVLNQQAKNQIGMLQYSIYEKTDLFSLYDLLLNVCNDDEVRSKYEEDFLKFKYNLLLASPEKTDLSKHIQEMVEGMVLVNTKSLFCWDLYFNWANIKSLDDLDEDKVLLYIKNFHDQGLGTALYAYAMSDISQFNKEKMLKEIGKNYTKKADKETVEVDLENEVSQEQVNDLVNDDEESKTVKSLPPGKVLSLMLDGLEKSPHSLLVNRIVCEYYIHIREYSEASKKCRELIQILADMQRNLGIDLDNTKESVLCSLAVVYTYHEAPKNYPRALELYERILKSNPANIQARIGKGLILIEKRQLEDAKVLLKQVVDENPTNQHALQEYGWCLIKDNRLEEGRTILIKCLENMENVRGDVRALIRWRIAKSYLSDEATSDQVNQAYEYLIKSLKDSETFAPSYSLLGVIFHENYGDKSRAQKCFYKAYELDVTQIIAAKYLVEDLAEKNEWDIAEILSTRLVTSEDARRILLSNSYEDEDRSWPYRILGCASLNRQDDAKAIEWFQTALRMKSMDVQCWIGLGEAYVNCGRLDAAAKVFRHILNGDTSEDHTDIWVVEYMLGYITCQMGEFNDGLWYLGKALAKRPNEEPILAALLESYIENSKRLIAGGFFGRAVESNLKAIDYIESAIKVNPYSPNLWKLFGDCLRIFLVIQEKIDVFPVVKITSILSGIEFTENPNDSLQEVLKNDDINVEYARAKFESKHFHASISSYIILTQIAAIKYFSSKISKYLRSVSYYNLGLAYLEAYNFNDDTKQRDLSIVYFKKAIQLEGNNASFWVGLGNAYVSSNPHISQHCFIKAISLESRDAGIWTNLAALYLRYGDSELAQEAFSRAQSVAPQESGSWLGSALAAEANGDVHQAHKAFTHAFVLSNGGSPLAQFLYGISVLSNNSQGSDPREIEAAQEFGVANFAMQQYLKYCPTEVSGLQVALAIAERCKNYDKAVEIGLRLCSVLEHDYETSESEVTLINYAKAKTQVARVFLGLENYEQAVENAQYAINLIESEDDSDEFGQIKLSSRVVIGLGLFFNNEFNESLQHFQVILEQHSQSKRVVTLVAQILYAHGTEDTKQAALDQLFTFIEENGSSLMVVLTLGAISVADNLTDYFAAIKEELEGLPLQEIVGDAFKTVPKMLAEINKRMEVEERVWQKSAMLFPSDFNVWRQLNSQMALCVASLRDTKLNAAQLAGAYRESGNTREIQRSMLLCPGSANFKDILI